MKLLRLKINAMLPILTRFEKASQTLLLLMTVVTLSLLLNNHMQIINSPVPLDYYEGTMPAMTSIIAQGKSIYSIEQQPEFNYVYTPLYNYITAPLTKLFGNTLQTHRFVTAFFIFSSVFLCFFITLKNCRSLITSAAVATTLYAALIYYSTVVASTNSTGLFFFLATVFIPWLFKFNIASLALAIFTGILSFYSKQYFVLGLAFVSIALFLSYSIKRSVYFSLLSASAFIASLYIVNIQQPYFLDNTLFGVKKSAEIAGDYAYMVKQLLKFFEIYAGLICAIATAYLLRTFTQRPPETITNKKNKPFEIQVSKFNKPFTTADINYFLLSFILSTAVIVISLGKHQGNYMTYLFQIMSPFFIVFCFSYIKATNTPSLLALPFIAALYYQTYFFLPQDFSVDMKDWDEIHNIMEPHDDLFVSPILMAELVKSGKKIRQAGQTFYFPLAQYKPAIFVKSNPDLRVKNIWDNYLTALYNDIEEQKIDLIILNKWDVHGIFGAHPPPNSNIEGKKFLKKYYRITKKLTVAMTDRPGGGSYEMIVYEPKKNN